MIYAPSTRVVALDPNWANGDQNAYPPLYDDGPWTVSGHEPVGADAGDHLWGITVFAPLPAAGIAHYEYGATDYPTGGWLWRGPNGVFEVDAGDTRPITATGLTLLAFGHIDLKIVVDMTALAVPTAADGGALTLPDGGAFAWDTTSAHVKSSAWGWQEAPLYDDATQGDDVANDRRFTFVMSNSIGPNTVTRHFGLLSAGDQAQFVVELGALKSEYKILAKASSTGVTAYLKAPDGGFEATAITHTGTDGNCVVTVP